MKTGLVYNIQRFCTHDGPGLRTVIFLKGCPLSCHWCCNPESQSSYPELMYNRRICLQCGDCITGCPKKALTLLPAGLSIDRRICDTCGVCTGRCYAEALQIVGKEYTTDEIISIVLQDIEFYKNSGGGITFSGGEPLSQPLFVLETLQKLTDASVHTAIETSGAVEWEQIERVSPLVNLFLYDLKHVEDSVHRKGTEVGNKLPLDNLKKLARQHSNIIVRVPLIPNFNMDKNSICTIGKFVKEQGLNVVHLLPYHRLGQNKYEYLSRAFELAEILPPSRQEVEAIAGILQNKLKLEVVIDG